MIVALVASLFLICGPATVSGFVSEVIVYSVDSGSARSRSHVSSECCEVISPLITNRYASASVARECVVVWIQAPFQHSRPDDVLRAPVVWGRASVLCGSRCATATATCVVSGSQSSTRRKYLGSAVASAFPDDRGTSPSIGGFNRCEPSVAIAAKVYLPSSAFMSSSKFSREVSQEASATTSLSGTKSVAWDCHYRTAFAGAIPSDSPTTLTDGNGADFRFYGQPSKRLTDKVQFLRHRSILRETSLRGDSKSAVAL
jgi:hypothetical protein